jgi:hypothetical protein
MSLALAEYIEFIRSKIINKIDLIELRYQKDFNLAI